MLNEIIGNLIGGVLCAGVMALCGLGWQLYRKLRELVESQQRTEHNLFVVIGWLQAHEQTIDRHEIAIARLQARDCDS